MLRANDCVGLYAVDVQVLENPPMTCTRLIGTTGLVCVYVCESDGCVCVCVYVIS